VPDDVTGQELDKSIREELRTLSREASEIVSRHLVMSARLLDDDPAAAWEHAKAAVTRGGRLGVVREAAGISAYRAGEYADALAQFRAARRISGSDSYWPIMADCERGLGRPERALTMAGAPEVERLDRAGKVEMRIVASGARRDLGQLDAAIVTLQCQELTASDRTSWSARLKFAYADALLAADRTDEAREWFERAQQADADDETDAAERLAELDGIVWIDAEDDEDEGGDLGSEDDDLEAHGSVDSEAENEAHGDDDVDEDEDEDEDSVADRADTDHDGDTAEDSVTEDGVTEDGVTEDGVTEDGVTEDNEVDEGGRGRNDGEDADGEDADGEVAAARGIGEPWEAATSLRFEAPAIASESLVPEPLAPGVALTEDDSDVGDDLP
jgi:tetratricopeptide (TPR) repeat protein